MSPPCQVSSIIESQSFWTRGGLLSQPIRTNPHNTLVSPATTWSPQPVRRWCQSRVDRVGLLLPPLCSLIG